MARPSARFSAILVLVACLWFMPTVAAEAQVVSVAAAANLSVLETPISQAFARASPGLTLRFTFGASGTLVTQLLHGAPFDVFLSADLGFAQRLVDACLSRGPVRTYARGKLVFLSTTELDLRQGLAVLAQPRVTRVALANPETTAYGKAAVEALTKLGLLEAVKPKLIQAQSVAQALQFTLSATGFGFVGQSALVTPDSASGNRPGRFWFAVDPDLYTPLDQGYVVLNLAAGRPEVRAFQEFLTSAQARAVFESFGYTVPAK